jgi:hypothetical protein
MVLAAVVCDYFKHIGARCLVDNVSFLVACSSANRPLLSLVTLGLFGETRAYGEPLVP